MVSLAIPKTSAAHPHRTAARDGEGGAGAEALRREGRASIRLVNRIKRLGAFQNPRVLQEAEHAPLHRDDFSGHRLRRGPPAVRRTTARVQGRRWSLS